MIRIYYLQNKQLVWEKHPEINTIRHEDIIWVDLQKPDKEEVKRIEKEFNIEFFTPQEAAEIESTSRYFEDLEGVEANSGFVIAENGTYKTEQVSFIIKRGLLFTLRNADLKSFAETVRKLKTLHKGNVSRGFQIWLLLLENRIDLDADFIENITRVTNVVSGKILKQRSSDEEVLLKITELQENTIRIRESIVDKQRLISSLLKSMYVKDEDKNQLRDLLKDISSLLEHTQFSFERLEYLQNTFLGLVNIEQNQVIKIFTVVTVVFMPPTLIASIYGMNFEYMPELHWKIGYPLALGLMVLA
ncbi:MAG: magnesium/cobalt transporter CorA, partial [Cyclobacteriaceae bacterium]